ncbi:MAG: hypothetical protein HQK83_10295 [Fibrobacteria bacterium]|nr:hypothetical protein [Fibrobacteria bacterium]
MKITTNYSENLPGEQYKTHRWAVELTQEIAESADAGQVSRNLFSVAKSVVKSEVEMTKTDAAFTNAAPSDTNTNPAFTPPPNNFNSQNRSGPRPATEKQIRFLYSICKRQGFSNEQISALPNQYFGKSVLQQLTSKECSQLIDSLNGESRKAA